MSTGDETWGADGPISVPVTLEHPDTDMADFDGFCFTPQGIRVNMTAADREHFLRQGYGPLGGGGETRE